MYIIEMTDYNLGPVGLGHGISGIHFRLRRADVCVIETDQPDDAHTFLRALATLVHPLKGAYAFEGLERDLSKYGATLCCKQKIGYIAADSALISNLNIRQNLLLQRYYHENRLDIDLHEKTLALCEDFGIQDKLLRRPSELKPMEIRAAIIIREITKKPTVLLLDQPADLVGQTHFDLLVRMFNDCVADQIPIVFTSSDPRLAQRFANRKIVIAGGTLTASAFTPPAEAPAQP